MSRTKAWSNHDREVMRLIEAQQVTGYRVHSTGEHFRTLDGTKITRQVLEFERYGMVAISRASPVRYELALTATARALIHRYKATAFRPSTRL